MKGSSSHHGIRAKRARLGYAIARPLIATSALAVATAFGVADSAAAATSTPGVTSNSITIGTTDSLTGPIAADCGPMSQAADAWFKSVNAAGGVNGRMINVKLLDDANSATEALANARTFVSTPVFSVFGGCGSVAAAAILPFLKSNEVPYFAPWAGIPELLNPPSTSILALDPLYQYQGQAILQYALKKHGNGSIYTLFGNTSGVENQVTVTHNTIKRLGSKLVGSTVVPIPTTDFTPVALQIKAAHPQYLYLSLNGTYATALLKALIAQNALPSKAIFSDGLLDFDDFLGVAPKSTYHLITMTDNTEPLDSPGGRACAKVLKKYAPNVRVINGLYGCATAQALVTILKKAGHNLTRASFEKALTSATNLKVSGLMPPISYSPKNRMGVTSMPIVGISNSGSLVPITTVKVPSTGNGS